MELIYWHLPTSPLDCWSIELIIFFLSPIRRISIFSSAVVLSCVNLVYVYMWKLSSELKAEHFIQTNKKKVDVQTIIFSIVLQNNFWIYIIISAVALHFLTNSWSSNFRGMIQTTSARKITFEIQGWNELWITFKVKNH